MGLNPSNRNYSSPILIWNGKGRVPPTEEGAGGYPYRGKGQGDREVAEDARGVQRHVREGFQEFFKNDLLFFFFFLSPISVSVFREETLRFRN